MRLRKAAELHFRCERHHRRASYRRHSHTYFSLILFSMASMGFREGQPIGKNGERH